MPDFATPLDELAYRYGSDKTPLIKHSYTEWYWPYFKDRRDSIRKLLEIGIGDAIEMAWTGVPNYQTGASLRMWRDFFPLAQIYGADIKDLQVPLDRIQTFQCDQSDKAQVLRLMKQVGTDLDVVIEDGSHKPDHQVMNCKTILPMLSIDAVYIIEDVGHPEIMEQLTEFECEHITFRPRRNRDNRLLVLRRKRG